MYSHSSSISIYWYGFKFEDISLSRDLDDQSHQSDYAFVNAVHRSPSLDSIVNRNMIDFFVKGANSVDGDADSLSFSFNLATRAEK